MKNRLIVLLSAAAVSSVCILMFAVANSREPRFDLPPRETAAAPGLPAPSDDAEFSIADCGRFSVGLCASPACEGGRVMLYFANPAENTAWLKVRLYDETDRFRGESGILLPGEFVGAITVTESVSQCRGWTAEVLAYEPETYHSMGTARFSLGVSEGLT